MIANDGIGHNMVHAHIFHSFSNFFKKIKFIVQQPINVRAVWCQTARVVFAAMIKEKDDNIILKNTNENDYMSLSAAEERNTQ